MPEITENVPFHGEELPMTTVNLQGVVFDSNNYQIIRTIAGILKGQAGHYRNIGTFFSNFSADEISFILKMYQESNDAESPNNSKAFTQLVLLTSLFLRSEGQTDLDDLSMIREAKANLLFLVAFETVCRALKYEPKRTPYTLTDLGACPIIAVLTLQDFKNIWDEQGFKGLQDAVKEKSKL